MIEKDNLLGDSVEKRFNHLGNLMNFKSEPLPKISPYWKIPTTFLKISLQKIPCKVGNGGCLGLSNQVFFCSYELISKHFSTCKINTIQNVMWNVLGMALTRHQECARLRQLLREQHLCGQHCSPHLTAYW